MYFWGHNEGSEKGDAELRAGLSEGHPSPTGGREKAFRAEKGAVRASLSSEKVGGTLFSENKSSRVLKIDHFDAKIRLVDRVETGKKSSLGGTRTASWGEILEKAL